MSAATSYQPLLDRIYEVLCDGAGSERTIPPDHRFRTGLYPGQAPTDQSRDAHEGKRAWVTIVTATPGDHPEHSVFTRYTVALRIDLAYFITHPAEHSEWRKAIAVAADDQHRVRAALSAPAGNLVATELGASTGLVSGRLVFESWTLDSHDPQARVLRAVARFQGIILLAMPS